MKACTPMDEPSGLSVALSPDDSGISWDIEIEKVGESATGELRFRFTTEEGSAEAASIVEE